jgi:hypothetical protein
MHPEVRPAVGPQTSGIHIMSAKPKVVMRSLRRRIEALERQASPAPKDRERIASRALDCLSSPIPEQLLSTFGAASEGRPLNAEEAAAKRAYQEALLSKCRWAGYGSTVGFEDSLRIHDLIIRALAQTLTPGELELAREALIKGQDATAEQSGALQKWNDEWTRLSRLAGRETPMSTANREEGSR